jgi:hypothetical protein
MILNFPFVKVKSRKMIIVSHYREKIKLKNQSRTT